MGKSSQEAEKIEEAELQANPSLEKSDLYREGGYLFRYLCQSRISVLSVTLPVIFGVDLLLLKGELNKVQQVAVTGFGVCMYAIAILVNNYYAKRIKVVRRKMKTMETSNATRCFYVNLDEQAKETKISDDPFSWFVYLIGGLGMVLILALYPQWVSGWFGRP